MKCQNTKHMIRKILKDIETETLAALQLGGVGMWVTSKDVMQILEETKGISTYYLGHKTLAVMLRETKFPKLKLHRRGAIRRML